MMKLHFLNVAEGDSILLEYVDDDSVYRVLVDTGRKILPESAGSRRHTASYYLKKLGIKFIDILIITHLHVDHVQDLSEILEDVKFGKVYSTFFPEDPSSRILCYKSDIQEIKELVEDLNGFAECVQCLDCAGSQRISLLHDTNISLPNNNGELIIRLPMINSLEGQNLVYAEMFKGSAIPEKVLFWAAQSRNPNSLRVIATYAGKTISLDGDYYACYAEKELQDPVDILKVGHHGDSKSMTAKLASMLKPRYAVISCMREYDRKKDRPSKTAADYLRKYGAEIFYTDCFEEEGYQAHYHEELLFIIESDGNIIAPEYAA